jgi:acetyl-CoA synthetase
VRWFGGGTLNITENALDRHAASQPDAPAIQWEPNDPARPGVTLTYKQLLDRVMECAHMFRNHGLKKGDRVCVYMPMVPELPIALLAIARIGAIHSVVFGGFSAQSIADRINDSACSMVITADHAWRGAKQIPLKYIVNEALDLCTSVQKVFVFPNTGETVPMMSVRDLRWDEELQKVRDAAPGFFPAAEMDAEDMLFILYTSGSTGKPKGVVHTCAGYMVWATYTFINAFHYEPGDLHFCTADIGWITGHSYILYGPLCAGASVLMYEGLPNWPDPGRLWDIVDKHRVNILYTAPTAIRSLMQNGDSWLQGKKLDSLRTLGSVGEPINVEAWKWFHEKVGHGKLPLADTWWQTETGGIMISGVAGVTESIPAWAGLPLPGVQPALMDEQGREIQGEGQGNLCMKFPWPGMIRTTYGDHERCRQNYFSAYPGMYFTGDGALRDAGGNYRITGRVDDVLNVSGHRIGTAELENAINEHPFVVESAVVGYPHDIKGQGIYAFVILGYASEDHADTAIGIANTVAGIIGPIARPDKIQIVPGLPKTRSGKIMRRILRKIAEGHSQDLGDTSTLLDPAVVEQISAGYIK